jgi:hypothetical protein
LTAAADGDLQRAARRLCGLTFRELGVAAGAGKGGAASMSVSAVSKTIRRLEQRALRDRSLRTLQSRILEMSNVDCAEEPPRRRRMPKNEPSKHKALLIQVDPGASWCEVFSARLRPQGFSAQSNVQP